MVYFCSASIALKAIQCAMHCLTSFVCDEDKTKIYNIYSIIKPETINNEKYNTIKMVSYSIYCHLCIIFVYKFVVVGPLCSICTFRLSKSNARGPFIS